MIEKIRISGKEVFPVIEGGKGIGISNGYTAGAFAKVGAVGTFSGANAEIIDKNGKLIPLTFKSNKRLERYIERIEYSIQGSICQARIANEISGGNGRIHMNLLWGMSGTERTLHEILKNTKGILHGVTCGAGMPYKLGEIASSYKVYYYPIISSMRAFKALWTRAYKDFRNYLGGVVYEDPWKAGGHNGLSNKENPKEPEKPYSRVVDLRNFMNSVGLHETPIIMAGGVWNLDEYKDWFNNSDIGPIAFQFGTRAMLTKESPISEGWKRKLLTIKEGDVVLNKFSPTGFYSSAVNNNFIRQHINIVNRQINYSETKNSIFNTPLKYNEDPDVYINNEDVKKVEEFKTSGNNIMMKTPDNTLIFVSSDFSKKIIRQQAECTGCLEACKFSSWSTNKETNYNTGIRPDPRSYCIIKTLGDVLYGGDIENELVFSGHNAFRFAKDPFYNNGFIPTIKELVDRILSGK
ncbi:MAG: nitronate monooxygenase [Bacteroidota bacterium]|nr:nitronate monooxygenase [Bacteroidota bacterium]